MASTIKRFMIGALCTMTMASVSAADFFSTEKPDEFLTLGARIGVNTTNRTLKGSAYPGCYHRENWGTGFDIGVVAAINIRDYLSIQPGFFFESRSGSYTLMGTRYNSGFPYDGAEIAQAGKRNSYNFTIPVMAIVGFNLTDEVKWSVEAGPYVAILLNSKLSGTHYVFDRTNVLDPVGYEDRPLFNQHAAPVDFGFKLGTGIRLFDHYYVGVHYMAGCLPAWKDREINNLTKTFGGVTKGWIFSIGYDL